MLGSIAQTSSVETFTIRGFGCGGETDTKDRVGMGKHIKAARVSLIFTPHNNFYKLLPYPVRMWANNRGVQGPHAATHTATHTATQKLAVAMLIHWNAG